MYDLPQYKESDPEVIKNYPGRLGFTDANSSPDPQDYNEHGGIYLHLARHGVPFVNFGNGYEFAEVDEDDHESPPAPAPKIVRNRSPCAPRFSPITS